MMENGDGSVSETVSGILICQWLLVHAELGYSDSGKITIVMGIN